VFTSGIDVEVGAYRVGLVLSSLYEHFRILLFPLELNALYRVEAAPLISYRSALAVAGVAVLLSLAFRRGISPPLRWGSAWLLLSLLPVANIVSIPSAPAAERYLYIPLMGFSLLLGHVISAIYNRRKILAIGLLVALSLLYGLRTYERNNVWKDNMSLSESMVRSDPANPVAHGLLGLELQRTGKMDVALLHLNEAARLNPEDPRTAGNLGNLYFRLGEHERAIEHYERALGLGLSDIRVHYNIALAAERLGDEKRAQRHYRAFIEWAERSGDPFYIELMDKVRGRIRED
jgi:tetratricopeptide (TPR) repeat protein